MTYEITDRDDFKDKFAALMASNVSLITAGLEPSQDLSEKMIEEFLNQFTVATPMPATRHTVGFVVVATMTGYIPGDFKGLVYTDYVSAYNALDRWFNKHGRGKISAYEVREVFYFG